MSNLNTFDLFPQIEENLLFYGSIEGLDDGVLITDVNNFYNGGINYNESSE